MNRITLLGCPIDSLSIDQTIQMIDVAIQSKKQIHHVVVNAAKLVNMQKDNDLKESVVSCDIINADGQSVVWGAKVLGKYLPERVAGIDLMSNLVEMAHNKKYKIFLLGASKNVVQAVVDKYSKQYSDDIVAGYRDGYFSNDEEPLIAAEIGKSGADMLFVAISSPKKEIFLNKYKTDITVPFIMGVGGSFDIISGKTKRAPLWMQKGGLEWAYRVYQEPRRMWKRYLVTNSMYIYYIIMQRIGLKKFE